MDLSKLLGDLYDAEKTAAPPGGDQSEDDRPADEHPADHRGDPPTASALDTSAGPEWSDEAHLDEVFASWTPGPPSDAPAAERAMGDPDASDPRRDAPLPQPRAEAPVGAEPGSEVDEGGSEQGTSEPAQPLRWVRAHDDVLPHRRGGRRGPRLNLLRR
ncbi:MAG: hypothetical protein M3N31_06095 [Actinomycetota bacterium]|nr:hypothetical protein [Actinomycetota bacterium]